MGFGLVGGRATTPYRNAEAAAQTDLAVLRACTSEDAVRIAVLQMDEGTDKPEADTTGSQIGVATDQSDAIMDAHAGPDQRGHSSPPGAHFPLVAGDLEEDAPTGNCALALSPAGLDLSDPGLRPPCARSPATIVRSSRNLTTALLAM